MSPFATILSELQQLQQSNPTQYQQVTQQISTNLQTAAQQATSEGNTSAANQLSQLSTDFSNASTSGQIPNVQDLAQAMSGHHHHGGHHHHSSVNLGSGTSSSLGHELHLKPREPVAAAASQRLSEQLGPERRAKPHVYNYTDFRERRRDPGQLTALPEHPFQLPVWPVVARLAARLQPYFAPSQLHPNVILGRIRS